MIDEKLYNSKHKEVLETVVKLVETRAMERLNGRCTGVLHKESRTLKLLVTRRPTRLPGQHSKWHSGRWVSEPANTFPVSVGFFVSKLKVGVKKPAHIHNGYT